MHFYNSSTRKADPVDFDALLADKLPISIITVGFDRFLAGILYVRIRYHTGVIPVPDEIRPIDYSSLNELIELIESRYTRKLVPAVRKAFEKFIHKVLKEPISSSFSTCSYTLMYGQDTIVPPT